jgi:hypothetical protein
MVGEGSKGKHLKAQIIVDLPSLLGIALIHALDHASLEFNQSALETNISTAFLKELIHSLCLIGFCHVHQVCGRMLGLGHASCNPFQAPWRYISHPALSQRAQLGR